MGIFEGIVAFTAIVATLLVFASFIGWLASKFSSFEESADDHKPITSYTTQYDMEGKAHQGFPITWGLSKRQVSEQDLYK